MVANQRLKTVSADDLSRLADRSGCEFRVVNPGLVGRDPLLIGSFQQIRLRDGLTLHTTDTTEIHDLHTEAMQEPSLTISLFLKGHVNVWFGGRAMEMGTRSPSATVREVEAVAIARSQRDSFARRSVKGAHIRKVNVTVTPEWLENGALENLSEHAAVLRFSREHLATLRWKASPRLIGLAEQFLSLPHLAAPLQRLYYESRAIDMVLEALQEISATRSSRSDIVLESSQHRRVQRACAYIEAHIDQDLTLQAIAAAAGMNPGSLQRVFRAALSTTIFEYVRGRKLDHAREALERDNISVGEAAYMVGYRTLGNFSTAFRRRFGITPRQIRTP